MSYLLRDINAWLKRYHNGLALDSNGCCYLQVDKTLTVVLSLTQDKHSLTFYCPVFTLLKQNDATLLRQALQMNLYQSVNSQGVIGYDETAQKIVYTAVLSGSTGNTISETSFRTFLQAFIANSRTMIDHLSKLDSANSAGKNQAAAPPQASMSTRLTSALSSIKP